MKLFAEACKQPESERRNYIEESCGGDTELRDEILSLLEHDRGDTTGGENDSVLPMAESSGPTPVRIGSYRIEALLGSGGLGSVYSAIQESPERRVAIKILRPGVASKEILRRFEHEARVLARLRHPGIAHVYEAGVAEVRTESGTLGEQPYLAMELVDGVPLDEYAQGQDLSTRDRLELIARVGDAVEHAHRNCVIHRDLKPQNTLVDSSGAPRILDFGIARATDADVETATLVTTPGQVLGTVAYMSPEQASGDPTAVDVRSDVYSLGVLLHELLSERLPYEVGGMPLHEALRRIREDEPTRLGSIHRTLRGEVETIAMKALEKDPAHRYGSAAELVADIRRYLSDEPIVARPPSTLYQLRKFAKRNRALVSGVSIAFLALAAGLVVSLVLYFESENLRILAEDAGAAERRQRDRVEKEAAKAGAINDFILNAIVKAPDPWNEEGRDVLVASVLADAASKVDTIFDDEPEIAAELSRTLAESFLGLGRNEESLEQFDRALAKLDELESLPVDTDLAPEDRANVALERELARLLCLRGKCSVLTSLGRFEEAEPIARDTMTALRAQHGESHPDVAAAHLQLGKIALGDARFDDARSHFDSALAMTVALVGPDHPDVARCHDEMLALHYELKDTDAALDVSRKSLAIRKEHFGEESPYTSKAKNELGAILEQSGDLEGAEKEYRESIAISTRTLGEEHAMTILSISNRGNVLRALNRLDEAETELRHARELALLHLGESHPATPKILNSLAFVLHFGRREREEARALYRRAVEIGKRFHGPMHLDTVRATSNLAWLERELENHEEALRLFYEALAGFERILGDETSNLENLQQTIANYLMSLDRHAEACPLLFAYVDLVKKQLPDRRSDYSWGLSLLGTALVSADRAAEAEPFLAEAIEICREFMPSHDVRLLDLESKWGTSLAAAGRTEEAEALLIESADRIQRHRRKQPKTVRLAQQRAADFLEAKGDTERAQEYRDRIDP